LAGAALVLPTAFFATTAGFLAAGAGFAALALGFAAAAVFLTGGLALAGTFTGFFAALLEAGFTIFAALAGCDFLAVFWGLGWGLLAALDAGFFFAGMTREMEGLGCATWLETQGGRSLACFRGNGKQKCGGDARKLIRLPKDFDPTRCRLKELAMGLGFT
jgi:hypothetical protein